MKIEISFKIKLEQGVLFRADLGTVSQPVLEILKNKSQASLEGL